MRLALLGPPGSGKGTQAARICDAFGLEHLASGDILRAEKAAGSPMGLQVRGYLDAGQLVPDELMLQVMREKIRSLQQGFILDGFPRTLPQAEELNRILVELQKPLELVLNFVAGRAALLERFSGRRICPLCHTVYHVVSAPPKVAGVCDLDGHALEQRPDDRSEVVARRIATYEETTEPLVAFYAKSTTVRMVDTGGSIEEASKMVLAEIRRHFGLK